MAPWPMTWGVICAMALEVAFLRRLTQTVKRHALTGHKPNGDPTFNPTTFSYHARVEGVTDVVVTLKGVDVKASNRIFVGTSSTGGPPNFGAEDEIVMPDGTKPRILKVNTEQDRFNPPSVHHQEVLT